jgi:flagellar motility protein MotE (MotC chaperone)
VTPEGKTAGEGHVVKVIKEGEAVEASPEVIVLRSKEMTGAEKWVVGQPVKEATVVKEGEGAVKVIVKKTTEAEPEIITWTAKETGKEGSVWVTKEFSGNPAKGAWISEGGKAFTFSSATDKDMLEKVHALQEQVAAIKAKKIDITALEESLKKLEAELKAKEEKLREFKYKFDVAQPEVTVVKKIGEDEAKGDVVVYEKTRVDKAEGAATAWVTKADESGAFTKVGIVTADNTIQILLSGIEGGEGRSTYPLGVAAVDRLKKDLPEGYRILESNYDKDAGTMTFKIAPPEGTKVDEKIIRKLVDGLKEAIKTKK